jgi:hypothetical protein
MRQYESSSDVDAHVASIWLVLKVDQSGERWVTCILYPRSTIPWSHTCGGPYHLPDPCKQRPRTGQIPDDH